MATPLHTSALLQKDNDTSGEIFNVGWTFTAGNDATLGISHYCSGGQRITSVVLGGTSATKRIDRNIDSANHVEIWDAFNIAGGTANVEVYYSTGSGHYISGGCQEWAAADSLAYDTGTANSAAGSGTAPSVSTAATTSQANTVVIAAAASDTGSSNASLTGPTGWTQLWLENDASAHMPGRGAFHEETTQGTKTATMAVTNSNWGIVIAAYTVAGGSSTQTLTPSLVTNTQTFHAPTVGRGAVTLTPSLVTNSQTFYSPVLSASYSLTPSLVTNSQIFYGPLVTAGTVTLQPSLVTNGQTFYSPTVSTGASLQELQPSLVTNTQTFYGAVVSSNYALTPGLFTNGQSFPAASVSAQNTLAPALVTNTSIFYSATVSVGAVNLQPSLVTNAQTFYAPTVLQQSNIELLPGLLTNEQSFFSPTVSLASQTQFGGWFTSAPTPVRTRKDRDEERQRLGILPAVEVPVTPAEVRELTHEDRQRAHRAAKKLLERFAPEPIASIAVVALPSPDEQPTIGPVELPMEVQATLIAAQKKRAFEQDLVYIVATLIS